jgi:hypothetical protein
MSWLGRARVYSKGCGPFPSLDFVRFGLFEDESYKQQLNFVCVSVCAPYACPGHKLNSHLLVTLIAFRLHSVVFALYLRPWRVGLQI